YAACGEHEGHGLHGLDQRREKSRRHRRPGVQPIDCLNIHRLKSRGARWPGNGRGCRSLKPLDGSRAPGSSGKDLPADGESMSGSRTSSGSSIPGGGRSSGERTNAPGCSAANAELASTAKAMAVMMRFTVEFLLESSRG